MKKSIALFLACGIVLTALLLTGCQTSGNGDEKEQTTRTVVELNENNYWKYFTKRLLHTDISIRQTFRGKRKTQFRTF